MYIIIYYSQRKSNIRFFDNESNEERRHSYGDRYERDDRRRGMETFSLEKSKQAHRKGHRGRMPDNAPSLLLPLRRHNGFFSMDAEPVIEKIMQEFRA